MSDRLAELKRQRALIAEHLAWLDREIASASPASVTPPAQPTDSGAETAPSPSPASIDPAAILAAAANAKSAAPSPAAHSPEDDLAAKHLPPKRQPTDIQQDVRRGCLLYFVLATVAVVAGTGLLIWASQSPWFHEVIAPYLTKAFFIALVLALGAGIRSLVSKIRSRS